MCSNHQLYKRALGDNIFPQKYHLYVWMEQWMTQKEAKKIDCP